MYNHNHNTVVYFCFFLNYYTNKAVIPTINRHDSIKIKQTVKVPVMQKTRFFLVNFCLHDTKKL